MNVASVNRALIGLQLSLALFACPKKQWWCTTCIKLDISSARHNTNLTFCSSMHNMFGGLGVYFLLYVSVVPGEEISSDGSEQVD